MAKFETLPIFNKESNPKGKRRHFSTLSTEEWVRMLDLYKSLKDQNPDMTDEEAKMISGLDLITMDEAPAQSQASEVVNDTKTAAKITLDFNGGRLTSGSGLLFNPETQRENQLKEQRKTQALNLFRKIERELTSFLQTNYSSLIEESIVEILKDVQNFIDTQPEFPELIDYAKRALSFEKFLLAQTSFLEMKDQMADIKKGKYDNEQEVRRLYGECSRSELHPAFKNEFKIFGDFLVFLEEARAVDFEMDRVLQKLHNFSEKETRDIFNIPDDLLVEFQTVLVRFHAVHTSKFPFEFNNPIRPETIDTLEKYWSVFIEMLFGNLVNNIPVNYSQREYLQKKHDLMKLFASKAPCSQDEKILQRLKEFESFLEVYDKKLKAIRLLEKILCGKTNIQKNATNEKILKFSIGLVFSCESSKTELRRRIMEVGDGNAAILLQETDKKKFYQVLGWL